VHLSLSPRIVSKNSTPQEDRSTNAWTSASTNASWTNSMRLALSRTRSNENPPIEEDSPRVKDLLVWGEVALRASASTSPPMSSHRRSLSLPVLDQDEQASSTWTTASPSWTNKMRFSLSRARSFEGRSAWPMSPGRRPVARVLGGS
jgi:hypothetical protein